MQKSQLIKITKNYQITIPAKLRQNLNIEEGDYLEARINKGIFMFKPKKLVDIDPDQAWFWTDQWQKEEKEVEEQIANGEVKGPMKIDDFINELKLIKK